MHRCKFATPERYIEPSTEAICSYIMGAIASHRSVRNKGGNLMKVEFWIGESDNEVDGVVRSLICVLHVFGGDVP